jgi:hypothetical protein
MANTPSTAVAMPPTAVPRSTQNAHVHMIATVPSRRLRRPTQLSGVLVSSRRRTSDVFTPRAPSSTAAGSGGWRVRIWASTCWAVTWVFRRLGLTARSSTFFAAGVMRRRSFCMMSLSVGFFGTARIGRGERRCRAPGPGHPGPRDRATQRRGELAAGSRPARLRSRDAPARRAGGDRCQFGDHPGDEPRHWPASRGSSRKAPLARRMSRPFGASA